MVVEAAEALALAMVEVLYLNVQKAESLKSDWYYRKYFSSFGSSSSSSESDCTGKLWPLLFPS